MAVTGFWHGGITVSDTAASHRFYVDLLGLRLVADRTTDDPALLRVVGVPATALRVSMLAIPGSPSYVELVEYLSLPDNARPAGGPAGWPVSTPGTGHLCFYTDDLHGLWARLRDAGVPAVSPGPVDCSSRIPGTWCLYVRDPDGYPVELFEGPPYPQGRRQPLLTAEDRPQGTPSPRDTVRTGPIRDETRER